MGLITSTWLLEDPDRTKNEFTENILLGFVTLSVECLYSAAIKTIRYTFINCHYNHDARK